MKKFLLLLAAALFGLAVQAQSDVEILCYDSTTGATLNPSNNKNGSTTLVNYAKTNGGYTEPGWDNYRLKFTYKGAKDGVKIWSYQFNDNGLVIPEGDSFCMYIKKDNTPSWPKGNIGYTSGANNSWFGQTSDYDLHFAAAIKAKELVFYYDASRGDNCYRLEFYERVVSDKIEYDLAVTEAAPSSESKYVIQVWDPENAQDENSLAWDNSGGLYRVYQGYGDVYNGRRFPISNEYLRSFTEDNYGYKLLAFKQIDVSDPRYKSYISGTGYQEYKNAVGQGNGFAEDAGDGTKANELYVIDFTELDPGDDSHPGNSAYAAEYSKGIYVTVPSIDDIKDESSESKAVNKFYRGGIRFAFMDTNWDAPDKSDANDGKCWKAANRFVKWGHIFRINEMPRPLNAFPAATSNGQDIRYYTDDFGPAEWNGHDYSTNNNTEENIFKTDIAKKLEDNTNEDSKKGDSRLMSEYNFWLKRIYLEVAYHRIGGNIYPHFYLRFEGEYDLSSAITSETKWKYVAADENSKNFVSTRSNIFHGAEIGLSDPAFHRFYNLDVADAANVQKMLGCTLDEYKAFKKTQNVTDAAQKGSLLYLMDYDSKYTAETSHTLLDKEGNALKYFVKNGNTYTEQAGDFATNLKYYAENGKFYNNSDNSEIGVEQNGLNVNVAGRKFTLYFDPDKSCAPGQTLNTYKYNFPYSVGEYNTEATYEIPYEFRQPQTTFEVNYSPVWRHVENKQFGSNIDWTNFRSVVPEGHEGRFPVTTYTVSYYGDNSEEHNAESDQWRFSTHYNVELDETNTYWSAPSCELQLKNNIYDAGERQSLGFYVHYNVEAWYNYAFLQGGVFGEDAITDDIYGMYEGEQVAAPKAVGFSNPGMHTTVSLNDGRVFQIRPDSMEGRGDVAFTETITAIESVEADPDAEAPVEYFNLQGMRVANPVAGQIYIVRQGSKVDKRVYTL